MSLLIRFDLLNESIVMVFAASIFLILSLSVTSLSFFKLFLLISVFWLLSEIWLVELFTDWWCPLYSSCVLFVLFVLSCSTWGFNSILSVLFIFSDVVSKLSFDFV